MTIFMVAELPDFAAEVRLDLADAGRDGLFAHVIRRESSRHKREALRMSQKGKGRCAKKLEPIGQQVSGEGGIRTLGDVAATPVFETGPIGHSGTSPAGDSARRRPLPTPDTTIRDARRHWDGHSIRTRR